MNQSSIDVLAQTKRKLILALSLGAALSLTALILIVYSHLQTPNPEQALKIILMRHARKSLGKVREVIIKDYAVDKSVDSPGHSHSAVVVFSIRISIDNLNHRAREAVLPGIHNSMAKLFRQIFTDPACSKLGQLNLKILLDTFDTNGNPTYPPLASITINRSTAERIHWDTFDAASRPFLPHAEGEEYMLFPPLRN